MYTLAPRRRYSRQSQLSPFTSFRPLSTFGNTPMPPLMKTDISETETGYEFNVELPGYSKENVSAELKDGYLVISATISSEGEHIDSTCGCSDTAEETTGTECTCTSDEKPATDEKTSEGKSGWLRRERYFGSCRRMYYLGDQIDEDAITAKFENGLLSVSVPKLPEKVEQKKEIAIS